MTIIDISTKISDFFVFLCESYDLLDWCSFFNDNHFLFQLKLSGSHEGVDERFLFSCLKFVIKKEIISLLG